MAEKLFSVIDGIIDMRTVFWKSYMCSYMQQLMRDHFSHQIAALWRRVMVKLRVCKKLHEGCLHDVLPSHKGKSASNDGLNSIGMVML